MSKSWLSLLLLVVASRGHASTFVGNGGNAGDLDLAITLGEIRSTFAQLDDESSDLCRCPDSLAENQLCGVLRDLSEPQVEYCEELLLESKAAIASLVGKDGKVEFTWTDEPMVADPVEGKPRVVDAVAQNQGQRLAVVLNRPRFLAMPRGFRIALVTHELFHFVPVDGKVVSDDQPVGPFKDGKSLLDTLGAATAIAAREEGIYDEFAHLVNVSRAHKKFILQYDVKTTTHQKTAAKSLLKSRTSHGKAWIAEYKVERLGLRLGREISRNQSIYRTVMDVEEELDFYSLGAGFHWQPISTPLSRWGESHVSGFVELVYGRANYRVSDEVFSLRDEGKVRGAQLSAQVYLPVVHGFWGVLGGQIRYLNYRYQELDVRISERQEIVTVGGAYAF